MIDVKVPVIGESVTEAVIAKWIKKDEFVVTDETICMIESEKATLEVPALASGFLNVLHNEGSTVKIGEVIAQIDETLVNVKKDKIDETDKSENKNNNHQIISPLVKKIMEDNNVEAVKVKGTGAGGRITKEDIYSFIEERDNKIKEQTELDYSKDKNVGSINFRSVKYEKMSTLRKTISKKLLEAKNNTAMLTTFNEIDMSQVIDLKSKYNDLFKEKYGVSLGYTSIFAKASQIALNDYPAINSKIADDNIIFHDYIDISIAVSTPKGLVVPVVKDVQNMNIDQIELKIRELALKGNEGKLTIDEMTGGTFTITNGGVFGSLMSTPIINTPQSAVLGMHAILDRPVAINGKVEIRPMMYIALSYDHRIIDGRESVGFLLKIKNLIEDPRRLLLNI
ncbi:MAG: 2-oxoglutarate dehydrogenase complex dihydrolipoyllysine-residue succinyltransferase [Candidatus Delongbacteria bacterium]|nr:2-oxoglutarate dehydrogenase complex dihydrolipoyllysine-residue succinyltransferase [Candidatus Delongbacteria bacterium]MBN2836990.1 2-oxoglutarate dehydrogenase complex dihydrolipoyllysine-residue succinyltransferase [Candidatus Delongbacteria bacterium]